MHRDSTNVRAPIVFRAALYVTSNYNQLNVCPNPLLVCYKIARDQGPVIQSTHILNIILRLT